MAGRFRDPIITIPEKNAERRNLLLDEKNLLGQLESLAQNLSVEIRYETMTHEGTFSTGGLCRLKGEYVLIINAKASTKDKIEALAKALCRFDLGQVYLRPGLRDFLGRFSNEIDSFQEKE